jgi:hypothetical protein
VTKSDGGPFWPARLYRPSTWGAGLARRNVAAAFTSVAHLIYLGLRSRSDVLGADMPRRMRATIVSMLSTAVVVSLAGPRGRKL